MPCACRPRLVAVTYRLCWRRRSSTDPASSYSEVMCLSCGQLWRTTARYAARAPDAPPGWEAATHAQIRQALYPATVP